MATRLMRMLPATLLVAALLAGCASGQTPRQVVPARAQDLVDVDRRAEAAYREGRHAEAADLYETLVAAMPTDAGYWYRLGNAYVRAERASEAVLAYEQSLTIDPDNPRAWHNLGVTLMRQAEHALGRGAAGAHAGDRVRVENQRLVEALRAVTRGVPADTPSEPGGADPASGG